MINLSISNSQIIINEFQPIPDGEESEWIELYNFSDKNVIIDSLIIKDNKTSKNLGKFNFAPKSFVVVTKDTIELKQKYHINFQHLLNAKGSFFIESTFPALNNTTDEIRLFNGYKLLDSLYYDIKQGIKGKSFERLNPLLPSNENNNLRASISRKYATPLEINSIVKLDYDLDLSSIVFNQSNNAINITITNNGLNSIVNTQFTLKFINSEANITLLSYNISELAKDSVIKIEYDISNYLQGNNIGGLLHFQAFVSNDMDIRKSNDTNSLFHYISYPRNSIIINEFMSDVGLDTTLNQNTPKDMGEFVEFYNNSLFIINLKNFIINDASTIGNNTGITITSDLIIKPNEFAVITWDTNFYSSYPNLRNNKAVYSIHKPSFNLNITSDLIILSDEFGNVMDSVSYFNNWNSKLFKKTKNISLERINYNGNSNDEYNWSTCLDLLGSTPLMQNSITNKSILKENSIDITPNPFSPKGGGLTSNCVINYNFDLQFINLSISIYDMYGNVIREIVKDKALPSNYNIIWDGTDSSGNILPVGAYVVILEAVDTETNKTFQLKKLVAIGE